MAKLPSTFLDSSKNEFDTKIRQELTCTDVKENLEKKNFEQSDKSFEDIENKELKKSLWETILDESKELAAPYEEWLKEKNEIVTQILNPPVDYLEREIFPILLIAMEKMLTEARNLDVLKIQKNQFNGLDYLAEYLWNKNPKWPNRNKWLNVYDIPQFKLSMKLHPRAVFPKSWLWSPEEAASRIQRYVRGWLIRKRQDVQEMRQFWKAIRDDKEYPKSSKDSTKSKMSSICERYKLLTKKREKPF